MQAVFKNVQNLLTNHKAVRNGVFALASAFAVIAAPIAARADAVAVANASSASTDMSTAAALVVFGNHGGCVDCSSNSYPGGPIPFVQAPQEKIVLVPVEKPAPAKVVKKRKPAPKQEDCCTVVKKELAGVKKDLADIKAGMPTPETPKAVAPAAAPTPATPAPGGAN